MTDETTATTVEELAREAYGWFETAHRFEDEPGKDVEDFTRLKEGAPEWVTELVHAAHGEFLPDDWRYDCIRAACGSIADDGLTADSEFADGYVDVYNAALTEWLASNLNRGGYVDDAVSEFGWPSDRGIFGAIAMGQYIEAQEVYDAVAEALTSRFEELEQVTENA